MATKDYVNKITQGDCLELMKGLDSKSVDLIVTDPPYFNQGTRPKYSRNGHKDVVTHLGEWDKFKTDEEYLGIMKQNIREMVRVLKIDGSIWIFTNDRYLSYLRHFIRDIDDMVYASTVIWHKYNAPPRFIMKAGFISSMEMILFAYKGKEPTFNKPKNYKDLLNVWITTQTPSSERVGHPTQKPLSLMKRIVKISSNEGDLVLDPFIGSGTTAIAARQLSRNFIGFELNPEYHKIAEARIKQHLEQKKLFE